MRNDTESKMNYRRVFSYFLYKLATLRRRGKNNGGWEEDERKERKSLIGGMEKAMTASFKYIVAGCFKGFF